MDQIRAPAGPNDDLSVAAIVTEMNARRQLLMAVLAPPLKPSGANQQTDSRYRITDTGHSRQPGVTATPLKGDAADNPLLMIGKLLFAQWWQRHPAHSAANIAQDALADQAVRNPLCVVATGAALGSALVLLKPWRHIGLASSLFSVFAANRSGILARAFDVTTMLASRQR